LLLYTGRTFACFSHVGNVPDCRLEFINIVKGTTSSSAASFINLGEISSRLGLFDDLSDLTIWRIYCWFTSVKMNLVPDGLTEPLRELKE
jgi:hypothetical protein